MDIEAKSYDLVLEKIGALDRFKKGLPVYCYKCGGTCQKLIDKRLFFDQLPDFIR